MFLFLVQIPNILDMLFFLYISMVFSYKQDFLGGGFKYFDFHPYLGKWSSLTIYSNILQIGWNRQPVSDWTQTPENCTNFLPRSHRHLNVSLKVCDFGTAKWVNTNEVPTVCSWWISRVCLLKSGNWTKKTVYHDGFKLGSIISYRTG